MRYVQTSRGVLLGPQRHVSHQELLWLSGLPREAVRSAGFLAARYAPEEPWHAYGKSVGLGVSADPGLSIPAALWVVRLPGAYPRLVFSDTPALLTEFEPVPAIWGLCAEGCEGSTPVYGPLHPEVPLTADEVLRS